MNVILKGATMPMAKDKNIQWHPAFYGAMHLEFKENKEDLEVTEELILNTLPPTCRHVGHKEKTSLRNPKRNRTPISKKQLDRI